MILLIVRIDSFILQIILLPSHYLQKMSWYKIIVRFIIGSWIDFYHRVLNRFTVVRQRAKREMRWIAVYLSVNILCEHHSREEHSQDEASLWAEGQGVYIYMYIYVYMYMYIYVYMYMYIYTYVCKYVYLNIYIYTCMHIH